MMTAVLPDNLKPQGLYNESEAARLLGVNRSTLQRWRQAGKIKVRYRRINGLPVYRGADLIAKYNAHL